MIGKPTANYADLTIWSPNLLIPIEDSSKHFIFFGSPQLGNLADDPLLTDTGYTLSQQYEDEAFVAVVNVIEETVKTADKSPKTICKKSNRILQLFGSDGHFDTWYSIL